MNDSPLKQIQHLAQAAGQHAREFHGMVLDPQNPAAADPVLDAERAAGSPENIESLAACYGAWLGEWAVQRYQGEWIGLEEPAAPRLKVGGVLCSPIDAVRRRLQSDQAPSLREISDRIGAWVQQADRSAAEILQKNQSVWDALVNDERFAGEGGLPASRAAALAAVDPWLRTERIEGRSLLCLGAGGGRQGPIHALAGAQVTVVDLSEQQLDCDRRAAQQLNLSIRTVCGSIDALNEIKDQSFDLVLQPVSAVYVPDAGRVHAEVFRVLRPGGLYVVQHKQPVSLRASWRPESGGYTVDHAAVEGVSLHSVAAGERAAHRESGAVEFPHSLESLLGGLCRAGFVIEDFTEPPRADALAPEGTAGHRACYLPPYLKVKARRK